MGRDLLLRQLAQAEQCVAEGKALIANQQRLIVKSERDGHDVTETMAALEGLLMMLRSREADRAKILDDLSDAS
jgi:hypothetical protein